jgi:hypothetical protein
MPALRLALLLSATLAAALAIPSASLAAQIWVFDCRGPVKTENVFDGSPATERERHWRIVANDDAGYVKRDPELAPGCLERKVEICGCDLGKDAIRCRSLGITPQGEEVGMDFSIERSTGRMSLAGRRFDAATGTMIDTSGQLACTMSRQR